MQMFLMTRKRTWTKAGMTIIGIPGSNILQASQLPDLKCNGNSLNSILFRLCRVRLRNNPYFAFIVKPGLISELEAKSYQMKVRCYERNIRIGNPSEINFRGLFSHCTATKSNISRIADIYSQ